MMYLTIKQQPRLSKYEYDTLLELCRYAKNLFNEGLYNCRQYYFNESEYLNYEKNYHLLKTSENYKMLNDAKEGWMPLSKSHRNTPCFSYGDVAVFCTISCIR